MTVVLANGSFPRKDGPAWMALSSATRVVACDGAAKGYRRRFGRSPTVVVGDLDSLGAGIPHDCEVVRVVEQETNDLTKALLLCAARRWKNPIVVGAMGRRDDHALGNVFRALAAGVRVVTDYGMFYPVCGRVSFCVKKGTPVSVFATDPRTRMTSEGLAWPLDGVRFENLYCATLNQAVARRFVVSSDRPVYLYFQCSKPDLRWRGGILFC